MTLRRIANRLPAIQILAIEQCFRLTPRLRCFMFQSRRTHARQLRALFPTLLRARLTSTSAVKSHIMSPCSLAKCKSFAIQLVILPHHTLSS